jgi:predicted metalloprotease with PDZ domain
MLWAFEGVTSYYDDLALLRCGLIDRERYLGLLAQTISAVERGNGRNKQTLEQSSFDAWIKYYRQDENSPNSLVSYYTKGALVALCLDLRIRADSGNAESLDEVMRALWIKWRQDGLGLGETEWEQMAASVTGLNLSGFFERALRTTEALPLAELLATQGIELKFNAAVSSDDRGGFGNTRTDAASPLSWGVKASADVLGVKLNVVHDGGAAQAAGLSGGDVILAVDGVRVSAPDQLNARLRAGSTCRVHAFRRDELWVFDVTPGSAPADTCRLSLIEGQSGVWPLV